MSSVSASAAAATVAAVPRSPSASSTIVESSSHITRQIPPSRISSTVRRVLAVGEAVRGESISGAAPHGQAGGDCRDQARGADLLRERREDGTVNRTTVLTAGSFSRART